MWSCALEKLCRLVSFLVPGQLIDELVCLLIKTLSSTTWILKIDTWSQIVPICPRLFYGLEIEGYDMEPFLSTQLDLTSKVDHSLIRRLQWFGLVLQWSIQNLGIPKYRDRQFIPVWNIPRVLSASGSAILPFERSLEDSASAAGVFLYQDLFFIQNCQIVHQRRLLSSGPWVAGMQGQRM